MCLLKRDSIQEKNHFYPTTKITIPPSSEPFKYHFSAKGVSLTEKYPCFFYDFPIVFFVVLWVVSMSKALNSQVWSAFFNDSHVLYRFYKLTQAHISVNPMLLHYFRWKLQLNIGAIKSEGSFAAAYFSRLPLKSKFYFLALKLID